MYFIAAKKDTREIIELGGRSIDLTVPAVLAAYKVALATNYSTTAQNISVLVRSDSHADVARVQARASFSLVWTDNEITALDFSDEDSKRWVRVTASKTEIDADGVDTTTITVEVLKADKSGVDTNVTTSSLVPIRTPDGDRRVKVSVVDGVAARVFKTTKAGIWVIPSVTRFANVRVDSAVTIEALALFSEM